MRLYCEVEMNVPGITFGGMEVNDHPELTNIIFSGGKDVPLMKEVLIAPYGVAIPKYLNNENIIQYNVPADYVITKLVINEGQVGGRRIVMAQIFYRTEEEEHHLDHILVD